MVGLGCPRLQPLPGPAATVAARPPIPAVRFPPCGPRRGLREHDGRSRARRPRGSPQRASPRRGASAWPASPGAPLPSALLRRRARVPARPPRAAGARPPESAAARAAEVGARCPGWAPGPRGYFWRPQRRVYRGVFYFPRCRQPGLRHRQADCVLSYPPCRDLPIILPSRLQSCARRARNKHHR